MAQYERTNTELLYKLNKSDRDVNALIQANKNLVYSVLSRLRCTNEPEYESAGFEGLWSAIMTFDIFSEVAFSTYACRCILNAINDCRRKTAARNKHEFSYDFTLEFQFTNNKFCDHTIDVENVLVVNAVKQVAKAYIDALPTQFKAKKILLCWYASGFTLQPSEVAKITDTSVSVVSRTQLQLRAKLQSELRKLGLV